MAPRGLRAPLVLAGKDLRLRLRDRSLLLYGILAPFALAFIFSLLLSPLSDGAIRSEIGLADEDGSPVSAGLRSALSRAEEGGIVTLRAGLSEAEARELIAAGDLDSAIVVPAGFGTAVQSGEASGLRVLGSVDALLATQVAEGVANAYASRVRSTSLAVQTVSQGGAPALTMPLLVAQAAALPEPISLEATETSSRQLDPTTYYAAGMAVFFVFFIVQVGVTGLLDEERDGTMARLLAAPIDRSSILAGKVLTSVVLGVISMTALALASSLLMGADWGHPLAVAVLITVVVLAAAGIMALVAGFARTPEAAGNLQSIVAITLAALGGAFFQLPAGEGALLWLTRLTPHFWFLRGVGDLAAGGGPESIMSEAGAILLFALFTGAVGWWLLSRRLGR